MQIVLKLYSIKRGNSVSFSSGQQFKSRLQQSQIVQRTNIFHIDSKQLYISWCNEDIAAPLTYVWDDIYIYVCSN